MLYIYSAFPTAAVGYYKGCRLNCCSELLLLKHVFKRKKKNAGHLSHFCDCNTESLPPLEVMLVFQGISTLVCYSNLCSLLFDLNYFFDPGEV